MPLEDHFIYHPLRVGRCVGTGHDISLQTADGETLHARYLPRVYAYFNLLYLHGSRGNLASRARLMPFFSACGVNVLALDYRGYGQSTGKPSESGLQADALAAYRWLLSQAPATSVVVLGEGLGAGPACELAAAHSCGGLILLSAFTSLPELAAARYPWLPTSWVVRSRFDNLAKLRDIAVPKLVVHSRADEKVPFAMGERLFEAAAQPKQGLWLEGARHDEVYATSGEQLARGLSSFIASLAASG